MLSLLSAAMLRSCCCTPDHMYCCLQLGLKFPKPGAEAAHQHVIDLRLHPAASLMAAQGHTFPLIIRLETITEDGAKADHSLQVSMCEIGILQGTSAAMHIFLGIVSIAEVKHAQPCLASCWRPLSGCHVREALFV